MKSQNENPKSRWGNSKIQNPKSEFPIGACNLELGSCRDSETDSSLDFARDCGYITADRHAELASLCHEVGKMLGGMLKNPEPFLILTSDI